MMALFREFLGDLECFLRISEVQFGRLIEDFLTVFCDQAGRKLVYGRIGA